MKVKALINTGSQICLMTVILDENLHLPRQTIIAKSEGGWSYESKKNARLCLSQVKT